MIIRKSNLKLVPPSDPILNRPPKEFEFESEDSSLMFANVLYEKMKELGGIGLSANQVGVDARVFVLGAGEIKMFVFNPELVEVSKEEESQDEGCLTFPGIYMKVNRPSSIKVRFKNVKNETVETQLTGLTARIFLHEYDHMIGATFKNRVSKLKWDLAVKKKKNKIKKLAKIHTQKLFNEIKEDIRNGNHT